MILDLVKMASRQLGYHDHQPVGMQEPTVRIPKPAAVNGALRMSDFLPEIVTDAARPTQTEVPAGQTTTIDAAAFLNSRVADAGAHIIRLPEQTLIEGPAPVLADVPAGLRIVRPAPFSTVADGDDITASTLSDVIAEAKVDRATMPQVGVRIPMPRSALQGIGEAQIVAEITHAITLGVGAAVDRVLLSAIVAAGPAPFSFGAVAGAGLRFGDLRAIIGTGGAGAAADQGGLFVSGIPAETSGAVPQTVIAAFNRFGVIVSPEIELLAERIDASGGVVLTAWLGVAALVPDAGFAWTVA
jgi:hypothetical protein